MKTLPEQIEALKNDFENVKRQCYEATLKANDMQAEMCRLTRQAQSLLFGVSPGVVVERNGARYVVDIVEISSWKCPFDVNPSKPWLHGRKVRKDGRPSERSVNLFDEWVVVARELVPPTR